ncbi:hypothetical protein RhiirA1_447796 [Rhizophagus irregularis]|uniref:Uncharacterized protein n=1 Tax=Rhizophagus irregularis TaxID=588596 RepID=A0A2I1DT37_9GLOM|nr:hypothetical protein RhiirA1_447796 [Rhizophagus irregularis]PKY12995.1 hypothetical protein RhiirB3_424727 [Rhizophagus irregularis]
MAMAEENEFCKLYVAGIFRGPVEEKSEEEIDLPGKDKFSYNIAAILARDREVVAVNLRVLSDGCEISIAKNSFWLDKDREYVEKIKETLTNVSKYAPMKFEQACDREDMRDLFLTIKKYCFEKFEYILDKLRRDITEYEDKEYIKSFLNYVKTMLTYFDNEEKFTISVVGSYAGSLFNITNCRIDLKLLNPDVVIHPILPLNGVVKKFLDHEKEYESFMEACLIDPMIELD